MTAPNINKIDETEKYPRCKTVMTGTFYHPFGPGEERIALECPVCGPVKEYCPNGPNFEILVEPSSRPRIKLQITIKREVSEKCNEQGILIGNLLDKTKRKPVVKILKQGMLSQEEFVISFDLPEDIGYDLHTLRLI